MSQTLSTTYYRPGLVFKAARLAQGHAECCRRFVAAVYTPDGAGVVREEIPALWAEFGVYGGEFTYIDPLTDRTETGSEFRGGYFNLDVQAADKGWSDADKEIVARHMLRLAESGRGQFSLYSAPKAAPPWATYDETHHNQIATIAVTVGAVGEALVYEEQNKNRESVVAKLREELAKAQAETQDDGDLVAV